MIWKRFTEDPEGSSGRRHIVRVVCGGKQGDRCPAGKYEYSGNSGQQYRALGLKDRLPDMPEDEQFRLLASDPMLVRRPILIGDGFVRPGFKEPEWEEVL